jgi:hypothetical protein
VKHEAFNFENQEHYLTGSPIFIITHGQGLRLVKDQCKFGIYKRRWVASGDVIICGVKVLVMNGDAKIEILVKIQFTPPTSGRSAISCIHMRHDTNN